MHPFDLSLVREMHERIIETLGPVSAYIGLVEEAWLWKQARGVVMVALPGRKPQPLR
jgi:hypothetical protein